MAIPLKKFAMQCEAVAIANGSITPATSPTATLYDISRHWRDLCNATTFKSLTLKGWTEREECAAEVIIANASVAATLKSLSATPWRGTGSRHCRFRQ